MYLELFGIYFGYNFAVLNGEQEKAYISCVRMR